MKILIDIGHPAHVHYFRNFIKIMKENGHSFIITARDKEVAHSLLKNYEIEYIDRGKGKKNLLGKLLYMVKADFFLLKLAVKYQPDFFMSFSSPYAAQVAWLLRKPHIAFTDTEHATLGNLAFVPFSKVVCTPACFENDLGKKHIRFDSYMELCYLHCNYFVPDISIFDYLGLAKNEKYIIFRFVSWSASHDVGHSGLTLDTKIKAINLLSKHAKVFISSEGELPAHLKQYQIQIPPEKMHDALFFATLFIGEGATMASECAMIGTPAIYVNSLAVGYCTELEEKYGLIFNFRNSDGVIVKAVKLLKTLNIKQEWQKRRQRMLSDKIDVTAFMVWFVENYPESAKIMKENPDYQYRFQSTDYAD